MILLSLVKNQRVKLVCNEKLWYARKSCDFSVDKALKNRASVFVFSLKNNSNKQEFSEIK